MAHTSSIYDHFIIWSSSVTLTFNLPEQMFQMELLLWIILVKTGQLKWSQLPRGDRSSITVSEFITTPSTIQVNGIVLDIMA